RMASSMSLPMRNRCLLQRGDPGYPSQAATGGDYTRQLNSGYKTEQPELPGVWVVAIRRHVARQRPPVAAVHPHSIYIRTSGGSLYRFRTLGGAHPKTAVFLGTAQPLPKRVALFFWRLRLA